jgi:hypothetical protein
MFFFSIVFALLMSVPGTLFPGPREEGPRRLIAKDIKTDFAVDEAGLFARPAGVYWDGGRLFVVDSEEAVIAVFDRAGRPLARWGRKGKGPGELEMPVMVAPAGELTFAADPVGRRIAAFDRRGAPAGGFALPFGPRSVLALSKGRLLTAHIPSGRAGVENLLRCYDSGGRPLWEALKAQSTGNGVSDALANMVFAVGGPDEVAVVFRSGRRAIQRFDADGRFLGETRVDAAYPEMTASGSVMGRKTAIAAFCWSAAGDADRVLLLAPGPMPDGDLGPGRDIYMVNRSGRVENVIELPDAVLSFTAAPGRIFAVDAEGRLRIFEVKPR